MEKTILSVRDLMKSYGRHLVLDGLSLELAPGTMTAVCGPSGCGKSTLLNIVGMLDAPDAGAVRLLGEDLPRPGTGAAQRAIREHVSYLFQSFALVETETVETNLMMALRYVRRPAGERRQLVERAVRRVGLEGSLSSRVHELSGGEQQRVALARCMVKPGELVLADEPTGSVDPANRELIVGILRRMTETGKTVLVVTHDEWVARRCDRTLWLGGPRHGA